MQRTSSTKTQGSDAAPKLAQPDFDRASFRVAGKPATRAAWQAAVPARVGQQPVITEVRLAVREDLVRYKLR